MKDDSLDELKTAFAEWRRNKEHTREPMPEELRDRARRAAEKHGVTAVVGVTRVERARLLRTTSARMEARETTSTEPEDVQVPTFSRLELGAPPAPNPRTRPIAELETGTGVTLRMYEQTPEMMRLFSAVCGLGGVG